MKLKNIQIVIADKALESLIALKLPLKVKTNYKLAQISISIRSQASVIELTKSQLLEKHGITSTLTQEDPKALAFFKEWREMADIEVEGWIYEGLENDGRSYVCSAYVAALY